MKAEAPGKDLIALVADKNMEHALRGLLNRPQSLGIHPLREILSGVDGTVENITGKS